MLDSGSLSDTTARVPLLVSTVSMYRLSRGGGARGPCVAYVSGIVSRIVASASPGVRVGTCGRNMRRRVEGLG